LPAPSVARSEIGIAPLYAELRFVHPVPPSRLASVKRDIATLLGGPASIDVAAQPIPKLARHDAPDEVQPGMEYHSRQIPIDAHRTPCTRASSLPPAAKPNPPVLFKKSKSTTSLPNQIRNANTEEEALGLLLVASAQEKKRSSSIKSCHGTSSCSGLQNIVDKEVFCHLPTIHARHTSTNPCKSINPESITIRYLLDHSS
jgi:hypothetical protein